MPNRFDGGGTWQALLTIGRPHLERSNTRDGVDPSIRHNLIAARPPAPPTRARTAQVQRSRMLAAERGSTADLAASRTAGSAEAVRTVPYSLVVHAYSNLSLHARAEQDRFEPGATIVMHGSVAQSGIPLARRAQVWAEVTLPGGNTTRVGMEEVEDGQFIAKFETQRPGVYRLRIRASGTTPRGEAFTRERLLTCAVWRGGNRPNDGDARPGGTGPGRDVVLSQLLRSLPAEDAVITPELEKCLRELGVDLDRVRKCLDKTDGG
jgi:hypothetical protein